MILGITYFFRLYKQKIEKATNTWKLNDTLPNNQWVKEKRGNKKNLETYKDENKTHIEHSKRVL
jgi:hypothetical protein